MDPPSVHLGDGGRFGAKRKNMQKNARVNYFHELHYLLRFLKI